MHVWVIYLGYVPTHWEDSGRFPSQGDPQVDRVAAKDKYGLGVGIPSTGRGNAVGGDTGGGYI